MAHIDFKKHLIHLPIILIAILKVNLIDIYRYDAYISFEDKNESLVYYDLELEQ